jgi:hypothetical protein
MDDDSGAPPASDERIYPPFIANAADRKRWNLAEQVTREVFGPETPAEAIWLATRALFRSDIST